MKKHKLVVIVMLILLMSFVFTGCAGKRIIERKYDEELNTSTIRMQYINEIDIGRLSFDDEYYGIAGLYDTNDNRCEFTLTDWVLPSNKKYDERGGKNVLEIEFEGDYKGFVYRIWYMNSDDAYELDYNTNGVENKIDYIKKHAYIIEWKL